MCARAWCVYCVCVGCTCVCIHGTEAWGAFLCTRLASGPPSVLRSEMGWVLQDACLRGLAGDPGKVWLSPSSSRSWFPWGLIYPLTKASARSSRRVVWAGGPGREAVASKDTPSTP